MDENRTEKKKTAVVTGASSGIGKDLAISLAQQGYFVYDLSRSGQTCDAFKHIYCDITNRSYVKAAFEQISREKDGIDLLVNCAGCGISGSVEATSISEAKRIFDVNYFGAYLCISFALPLLRSGTEKKIINVSSFAAVAAIPFQAFYSSTKSALNSLTLALRNELKPFGIKICSVMPGDCKSGFTVSRKKTAELELYAAQAEKAVGIMEKDEENGISSQAVADEIVQIASKESFKPLYVIGGKYKFFYFLIRLLPTGLANSIIGKMYS